MSRRLSLAFCTVACCHCSHRFVRHHRGPLNTAVIVVELVFLIIGRFIFLPLGKRVLATLLRCAPSSQRMMPLLKCGPLPVSRRHPKPNNSFSAYYYLFFPVHERLLLMPATAAVAAVPFFFLLPSSREIFGVSLQLQHHDILHQPPPLFTPEKSPHYPPLLLSPLPPPPRSSPNLVSNCSRQRAHVSRREPAAAPVRAALQAHDEESRQHLAEVGAMCCCTTRCDRELKCLARCLQGFGSAVPTENARREECTRAIDHAINQTD